MGKSSKTFYCHNTHLVEEKGWPTNDKKGAVVINDWKNNIMFHIDFGKNPKVYVFDTDDKGSIVGGCRLQETVNTLAKKKADIAIKEFVKSVRKSGLVYEKPSKPKKTKVKKGFVLRCKDDDELYNDFFSSSLPY